MYIKITDRCNMECAHCCVSATKEGKDMSMATFRKALELSAGEYIMLGGGEPTMHRDFGAMIYEALGSEAEGVHVVTNGTHKRHSLTLARLSKLDTFEAELSYDSYHDVSMLSQEVLEAFAYHIRNTTAYNSPMPAGRALQFFVDPGETYEYKLDDECTCPDIMVLPNGDLKQCGCDNAPIIGNVHHGAEDLWLVHMCYNSSEYRDNLLDETLQECA